MRVPFCNSRGCGGRPATDRGHSSVLTSWLEDTAGELVGVCGN